MARCARACQRHGAYRGTSDAPSHGVPHGLSRVRARPTPVAHAACRDAHAPHCLHTVGAQLTSPISACAPPTDHQSTPSEYANIGRALLYCSNSLHHSRMCRSLCSQVALLPPDHANIGLGRLVAGRADGRGSRREHPPLGAARHGTSHPRELAARGVSDRPARGAPRSGFLASWHG